VIASGVEDALRPLGGAKFHHVPLSPSMISRALEQAGY
jgi:carbon-monoxide dehydrogenase large subunit